MFEWFTDVVQAIYPIGPHWGVFGLLGFTTFFVGASSDMPRWIVGLTPLASAWITTWYTLEYFPPTGGGIFAFSLAWFVSVYMFTLFGAGVLCGMLFRAIWGRGRTA